MGEQMNLFINEKKNDNKKKTTTNQVFPVTSALLR